MYEDPLKIHCWLRLRRHTWFWREGLHRLMEYRHCSVCGWPSGFRVIKKS